MRLWGRNNRIFAHREAHPFARMLALFMVLGLVMSGTGAEAFAQIASEDSLYESTWTYLFEDATVNNGVIQSICATPEYLITIENTAEDPSVPDTVSAYYKNPFDRNGNPVQQYSLAMRNTDHDWEHGNGMAYNPNTNEIYVALYSNAAGDNEGTLYVMDPDTLSYKGKIKIAEGYNILGIDYDSENDQYYTLTDSSASYSLQRRDASFNLIEDLGPVDPAPGNNFQDICLCGDYIFLSPLTYGMGIGDFMNVYSVSRRETLVSSNMNMGLEEPFVEAEGVCMAQKGMFVCPVTVTRDDGSRYLYFFQTTLPWLYTVETSARGLTYEGERTIYTVDNGEDPVSTYTMDMELYTGNGNGDRPLSENGIGDRPLSENGNDSSEAPLTIGGTVSAGSSQVLSGTSFTATFEPKPGHKVAAVYLDATKLDLPEGTTSYTLENVDGDHRITVEFIPTAKPTSTPTPSPSPAPENADGKDGGNSSGKSAVSGEDAVSGEVAGQSGSLSGTQITADEEAGARSGAVSSHRTAARNKAVLFVVLILLILIFGLGLLTVYAMHVRRVRERKRQAHREERRLRRLREESEEAEKTTKRRENAKKADGIRKTEEFRATDRAEKPVKTGRTGKVGKSENGAGTTTFGVARKTDAAEKTGRTRRAGKVRRSGTHDQTDNPNKVRRASVHDHADTPVKKRRPRKYEAADIAGKTNRAAISGESQSVSDRTSSWIYWDTENPEEAINSWLYGDSKK